MINQASVFKTARIASILLGIGLGGFVDGIALHQILQWHNMLSSSFPPDTLHNMQVNMTWDGFFHAADWLVTTVGVFLLWHVARQGVKLPGLQWFSGGLIMGWGLFNLVEGIIDHHLLGIHHVRYELDIVWDHPSLVWDLGFLLLGGVGLIAIGWSLSKFSADSIPEAGVPE